MKSQRGFTLIELLIVIAILGILAAVVVPQLVQFIGKGKVGAANAELAIVNTAIQAGMADAQLATVTPGGISSAGQVGATGVTIGNYIQGNYTKLTGSYAFGTDGFITGASYSGATFTNGSFK